MQLPSNFGKFKLLEFLNKDVAEVYRAHDTVMDRPVVMMILTVESAADAGTKAWFLEEARVAGDIRHDNIVSIFEYGEQEGRPYLAMEYVTGTDLASALQDGALHDAALLDRAGAGLIPRLRIAAQIAAALQSMHQRGVAHGDVKPENIRLDASGKAKLMNFGVAKTSASPLDDIYAWGMLASKLLEGRGDVPANLRALVTQATAQDPSARPQSFGVILAALEGFLGGDLQQKAARPVRQPESPARPLFQLSVIVYSAVTVVTLAAIGTWFWIVRPASSGKFAAPSSEQSFAKAMAEGMIDIPAGTFLAGPDKRPVMLKQFLIDATEVTSGDFCDLMPCDKPPADRDLPIVNITIAQARMFAMRVGKRLPTPLEWERAARGPNGNLFPWGDSPDPTLANVANNPSFGGHGLVDVKSFQAYRDGKASPDGAYQMMGNAWEFVEGRVMPSNEAVARFARLGLLKPAPTADEPWVSVRGGSFKQALAPDLVYGSLLVPERYSAPDTGFRCVKDPLTD